MFAVRRLFSAPRAVALAAATLLVLAGCQPVVGKVALRQVPPAGSARVFDNSDPAVVVAEGKTYLYGSTNNKKVPVREVTMAMTLSQSQDQWARAPRDAMPTRPAWVDPGEWHIWAPSVVWMNGKYVMFFASMNAAAREDEANDQCIGRAFSPTPLGPFAPEAQPFYCGLPAEGRAGAPGSSNRFGRGALDPEVFRGPDGRWWMTMALSRTLDNIGIVALGSNSRPVGGINGTPTTLVRQSLPWHDGTDDGRKVGGFLENPSMVYEPSTKTYLLFYSAGRWNSAAYLTGFARCAAPTGPCTADPRGPFLTSGNGRTGVGGLTVFRGADHQLRVAYASWQTGRENQSGTVGEYSRQTHFAVLDVSATTDPAAQTIRLR